MAQKLYLLSQKHFYPCAVHGLANYTTGGVFIYKADKKN